MFQSPRAVGARKEFSGQGQAGFVCRRARVASEGQGSLTVITGVSGNADAQAIPSTNSTR